MYEILANYRAKVILSTQSKDAAAANYPDNDGVDLWANSQLPHQLWLIVDVQSVGQAGTLDLIIQDSHDATTWDADWVAVAQIDEAGQYNVVVPMPHRYVRVNATVGTNAVVFGVYMITFDNQRRPVTQDGTAPTLTYGTGRIPLVASS